MCVACDRDSYRCAVKGFIFEDLMVDEVVSNFKLEFRDFEISRVREFEFRTRRTKLTVFLDVSVVSLFAVFCYSPEYIRRTTDCMCCGLRRHLFYPSAV